MHSMHLHGQSATVCIDMPYACDGTAHIPSSVLHRDAAYSVKPMDAYMHDAMDAYMHDAFMDDVCMPEPARAGHILRMPWQHCISCEQCSCVAAGSVRGIDI